MHKTANLILDFTKKKSRHQLPFWPQFILKTQARFEVFAVKEKYVRDLCRTEVEPVWGKSWFEKRRMEKWADAQYILQIFIKFCLPCFTGGLFCVMPFRFNTGPKIFPISLEVLFASSCPSSSMYLTLLLTNWLLCILAVGLRAIHSRPNQTYLTYVPWQMTNIPD